VLNPERVSLSNNPESISLHNNPKRVSLLNNPRRKLTNIRTWHPEWSNLCSSLPCGF